MSDSVTILKDLIKVFLRQKNEKQINSELHHSANFCYEPGATRKK